MYLRRKIDQYLSAWKESADKKPLIVKGARQIGKTESILRFAEENYRHVVYINFVLEPKYKAITEDGYSVDAIIKQMTLLNPTLHIEKGETLLFFDELQEHPDIATALKSFQLDGSYDVICSGSLLGIHYQRIHSNSVGYKTDYQMYALDFEEFLWAKGYQEAQIEELLEYMVEKKPLGDGVMKLYKGLFLDYCVLGGMPEVVRDYIRYEHFAGVLELQQQLLLDYEEDIRKYAAGMDQSRILQVFRHIPAQLAMENKKFQYSKIEKNARAREYQGCVEWLKDTGVVNICYCMNFPELPLKGNYDETKFKLYYADTGLLVATLDQEAQEDLRANKNLGTYKGALYENFAAEALVKQGYDLYYYKREDSRLEEDFFIRGMDELIPLEVKANNNRSKSLTALIQNERYTDVRHGIKFADANIGENGAVTTFPFFCLFLLRRYMGESRGVILKPDH